MPTELKPSQRVDKIVGPGNIYVALAKKAVFGHVDIDMIAGPSEIVVIADKSAKASYVAADLMSQAESTMKWLPILITDSQEIFASVLQELERQIAKLPLKDIIVLLCRITCMHSCRFHRKGLSCPTPWSEHLELAVENPMEQLGQIKHAGAIFLGHYTPEPVGDYMAGPNHVLPTSGTARFFSSECGIC